jgi:hypothetical protein
LLCQHPKKVLKLRQTENPFKQGVFFVPTAKTLIYPLFWLYFEIAGEEVYN